MKKTMYIWIALIAIVLTGLMFFAIWNNKQMQQSIVVQTPPSFEWKIYEGDVTLLYAKKKYPIGHYEGNCTVMASSSWKLLQDEVSGVICYFAGGGQELGIFRENNTFVLKEGVLDEGSAEAPGSRGNFRVLRNIP